MTWRKSQLRLNNRNQVHPEGDTVGLLDADIKKKLQKKAGERTVHASTQETDAAANPSRTEEGGPSKAVKHLRLDLGTPSPSSAQQIKKPKVPEQRTYTQLASNKIRVTTVLMA
jgi:hypothetical protein